MPRHKKYSALRVQDPCLYWITDSSSVKTTEIGEGGRYQVGFPNDALVNIYCRSCGVLVSSYHREPEIERNSVPANELLVGTKIKATRYIGWVGYAHSPYTVNMQYPELQARTLELFYRFLKTYGAEPDESQRTKLENIMVQGAYTQYNPILPQEEMMNEAFRRMEDKTLWTYRAKAYSSDSGKRGLWFSNPYSVEGYVKEIITIQTGQRSVGGYYYDEWEPNCLIDVNVHRLYGIGYNYPEYLVHPSDIVEVNP